MILYSIVALVARVYQALRPVPGHPWYRVWHKEQYVELPHCDPDGFRLAPDSPTAVEAAATAAAAHAKAKPAGSGSSSSSLRPSLEFGPSGTQAAAGSVFARHGWNIPTITAMAGSLAGASSHSTLGSVSTRSIDSSSFRNTSEYANSSASGSAAATPLARRSTLQPHAHLDTIFSIDVDDSVFGRQQYQQQAEGAGSEGVYQLDTQASLPAIPHVTASSLRCRHIGSDDGCSPASVSPASTSSPSSARWRHLRLVVGSPVVASSSTSSSQGSPRKQRPAGWDSPLAGTRPPPCSVMFEPEKQQLLLPASLVRQYGYYPLVLVQLPMYNEEAHCEVVIERACNMVWPRHRVIIQV